LLITQNDQCYFPACEVLLVSNIFIGAEKHLVSGVQPFESVHRFPAHASQSGERM
jgi:hypothetical protein